MSEHRIEAHKITKPIQLLAAWLVGLAIIDIAFLTAASSIATPAWISGLLAIAAVVNVPIFVVSIFLLQTKFRPEMQEDSYYSDYLNNKSDVKSIVSVNDQHDKVDINKKIEELSQKISVLAKTETENLTEKVLSLISDERIEELVQLHGDSRSLSELYLRQSSWIDIAKKWKNSPEFEKDIGSLLNSGLATIDGGSIFNAKLTSMGYEVAQHAEKDNKLFSQVESDFFQGEVKSNKSNKSDAKT